MRWYSLLCLGLSAAIGLTGCNNKGGSGSAPAQIEIPKTAEGTVTTVASALGDGKFEVIWQALPESYQGDVNHMIEHAAEHTDATVYNKVMGVVGKFVQVLSDKQDFILGAEPIKSQIATGKFTKQEATEALSAVAGLLNDIQKDIKTKDDLAKLDVEKYLANIGSRIKAIEPIVTKNTPINLGQKLADMKKVKATIKETSTDVSKVEITDADGSSSVKEFVKVEGKWIPKDLADTWKAKVKELDEKLHDSAELSEEDKKKVLDGAAQAEGILDNMLKATTQEQFDAALAPIALLAKMIGG